MILNAPPTTLHAYAEWALLAALERGDTSAAGLLWGFREHAPALALGQFHLGPTVTLFEHVPPPGLDEFPDVFMLRGGVGPAGLYVVNAIVPQDGNAFVSAGFVPAQAAAPGDIETVFDGEIARSRAGGRLLAALERAAGAPAGAGDMRKTVSEILGLHHEHIYKAHLSIREHADRLRAGTRKAKAGGAAAPANPNDKRGKPLLRLGRAEANPWVAYFPGKGHMVVAGSPEFTARFITLDGTFDDSWPEWVDPDTLFRPTTAKADPGLAERWQKASSRRLGAEVEAALAEAAQAAAVGPTSRPTLH